MESGYKFNETLELSNYNLSLRYKVTETVSTYLAYGYSETFPVDAGGRPLVEGFADVQESELLELGAKFSLVDGKFLLGTALVDREFTERNSDGSVDTVFLDSFEIEFNYHPNRNMFMTMGYSYSDQERTAVFYADPYTIDRANETGGLYINPTFQSPSTLVKAPGVPEHLVNGLFSYKWENGFGLNLGFLGWGKMNSGYADFPITIPNLVDDTGDYQLIANTAELDFQYEADLSLLYEHEAWAFKLTIFNITDEENWDVNNSGYGNGSIVSRLPVRYELSSKFSF